MSSSRNFWRRVWDRVPMFFKENIGRKLAALFLSTLIYGSVRNKVDSHVYIKDVPVRITMPDNLVLMDDAPRFVTVKLNGSKMVTQGVTENDISIDVRVVPSLYKSGSNIYPLTISLRDIKTPFGTSPVSVSPSKFNLAVNPLVSKMVEVTPDFESKPGLPSGYAIGKVSLNPKMVRIDGASSILRGITDIKTKPIPLGGITQNFDYMVDLALDKSQALTVSPLTVMAQVEVIRSHEQRRFSAVPVRVLASSTDRTNLEYEIVSSPNVEITVSGLKNLIETMRKDDLKPYVDISRFDKPGLYNVSVKCWSDRDGVNIRSIYPESISVKIEKSAAK